MENETNSPSFLKFFWKHFWEGELTRLVFNHLKSFGKFLPTSEFIAQPFDKQSNSKGPNQKVRPLIISFATQSYSFEFYALLPK